MRNSSCDCCGLFTGRYASVGGFANPSVYRADPARLVPHIRARVLADLAGAGRASKEGHVG